MLLPETKGDLHMDNTFNASLKRIRKEKAVTQEQLADAVGVSPQAVSKWEISSFPDAQLLPDIAAFLGVTIDELYGRIPEKEISMNQKTVDYFRSMPQDERIPKMFELCRAALMGTMGCDEYAKISESILKAKDWESHSQIIRENGWMQSRLNENLQYFLLMPQPENGYDELLAYQEELTDLFHFLSDPDSLRAMYYLTGQRRTLFFTANALGHELDISVENAQSIIDAMVKLKFVFDADLNNGSGKTQKVYQYTADCHFVAFMTFTRNLLHIPTGFNYQSNDREEPYFKNDTYKTRLPDTKRLRERTNEKEDQAKR